MGRYSSSLPYPSWGRISLVFSSLGKESMIPLPSNLKKIPAHTFLFWKERTLFPNKSRRTPAPTFPFSLKGGSLLLPGRKRKEPSCFLLEWPSRRSFNNLHGEPSY